MNSRYRIRTLGPALLMLAALALPAAARAAGDPNVVHVDGYFTSGRCPELREHDGKVYNLVGDIGGLQNGDHVRLEGRFTDSRACGGGTAVDVTVVQALWADDHHRSTYYDHLRNGSFDRWAAANRGYDSRAGRSYGYDRGGNGYDRGGPGYYNRRGNLRSFTGRVVGYRAGCLMLAGDDGRTYGMQGGDFRDYGRGDRVQVLGFMESGGACGDRTLSVQEIRHH